jgi:hypothetical protein
MDPVNVISTAIAAGAAAGLKDDASQAVRDAYATVVSLLRARYPVVDVRPVEAKPDSQAKRASLAEDLSDAGAADDPDLLGEAHALAETVQRDQPEAAVAIGVDLADVRAQFLTIERISAGTAGVRGQRLDVEGGITISDVTAGGMRDPNS